MPKPRAYVAAITPGAAKEAVFGVNTSAMLAALNTPNGIWVPCTEAEFGSLENTIIDDNDEINGYSGPTTQEVEMVQGTLGRKYYLTAETLMWLLALQLAEITTSAASTATDAQWSILLTGGTTAGKFTITWDGYTTAPISTIGVSSAIIGAAFDLLPNVADAGGDFVYAGAGPFTITAKPTGAYTSKRLSLPIITIVETLVAAGNVVLSETVVGGAAGVYVQTIKWPTECAVNPPSTEIVEGLRCGGSTGTYKLLTGLTVDQVDLEINSKGWINLTATLKYKDEIDSPGFTFPATPVVFRKIKGSKLKVFLGLNYTDEVPNTLLRSLKITIGSGIVVPATIGGDDTVPEYQYGEKKPDLAVTLVIKGDKGDSFYNMKRLSRISPANRFKFMMELKPVVTPQRKITFKMNQVFVDAKQGKEGNETRLELMLKPEWNSVDAGPGTWAIESSILAFLTAL